LRSLYNWENADCHFRKANPNVSELVHADLCGPMQEASIGGSRYFLLIKDDYTRWREVYFLKHKSETTSCLENFFRKAEKYLAHGIKTLRTDNGLEFINQEIKKLTQRYGIKHQKTVSYSPEQKVSSNVKIEPLLNYQEHHFMPVNHRLSYGLKQ